MAVILVLAHTERDGSLAPLAFEALGAAIALHQADPGSTLAVGLVGESAQAAANQIAECGAARILAVTGSDFAAPRFASDGAAAEALVGAAQAELILAPATSRWNRVLGAVALRLQGRADGHVSTVTMNDGRPTIRRWYYRQRLEASLSRSHRPWLLLLDPGSHAPWRGQPGHAIVESVPLTLPDSCHRTQVTGVQSPPAKAQTIRPDADLLLVAGAGWTKKQADGGAHVAEAEQLILDFLRLTHASLGSSKSLVDLTGQGEAVLSCLSHMNQVGQTGTTPRHPKGLATCCHGEEPHTVGWRFISERRAINLDPNCGWARGKADVLYVADAFAVMARLNALLAARH